MFLYENAKIILFDHSQYGCFFVKIILSDHSEYVCFFMKNAKFMISDIVNMYVSI